jgi:hypothetical protein
MYVTSYNMLPRNPSGTQTSSDRTKKPESKAVACLLDPILGMGGSPSPEEPEVYKGAGS